MAGKELLGDGPVAEYHRTVDQNRHIGQLESARGDTSEHKARHTATTVWCNADFRTIAGLLPIRSMCGRAADRADSRSSQSF